MSGGTLLVLDSLFDALDVESAAARAAGWELARWSGVPAILAAAEAVVHVATRIDAAMLEKMPACRVIGRFGTGLDNVDLTAAAARGIAVVAVRDYCIRELTLHTLALAFALDRRIGAHGPDGSWQEARHLGLPGRTRAAVVGFGSIGRTVAAALAAIGLKVSIVTNHARDAASRAGYATAPLAEALGEAEFLFLHAALRTETAGLIGAEELARLPPRAIVVNTARLGLVDEAALAAALRDNRIAGAGLDARLPAQSPLRPLVGDERLLVTPHIGWYSERSATELRRRAIEQTIAEAERLRLNARRVS
jgi:phosphoglycerate dehydrogenase-like enzyme